VAALAAFAAILFMTALPAGAAAVSPKPIGTTFAFPDTGGTSVQVTLLKVENDAPPKGRYKGLVGKRPVVGLEFRLRNVNAKPASLALFSTVLYYGRSVASLTGSAGATTLGPSLNLKGTMSSGSQREGWITTQGYNKTLQKIQTTLDGTSTGSWKP
jgi:hypothetical protein